MNFDPHSIEIGFYLNNSIWELVSITNSTSNPEDRYEFMNENYSIDVTVYYFTLRRRPLYFMIVSVLPALILNVICILSFALPFASQMALGKK
jgi:hypothetical protein